MEEFLSKATARPWQWNAHHRLSGRTEALLGPHGEHVVSLGHKANAALIVQAVNSFDAMREALTRLEDILGNLIESGRIDWTRDDAPIIHGELEAARDALKLAEGGE